MNRYFPWSQHHLWAEFAHVTNITRDILGYKNNTIVFFSTQRMSKHSSTPV